MGNFLLENWETIVAPLIVAAVAGIWALWWKLPQRLKDRKARRAAAEADRLENLFNHLYGHARDILSLLVRGEKPAAIDGSPFLHIVRIGPIRFTDNHEPMTQARYLIAAIHLFREGLITIEKDGSLGLTPTGEALGKKLAAMGHLCTAPQLSDAALAARKLQGNIDALTETGRQLVVAMLFDRRECFVNDVRGETEHVEVIGRRLLDSKDANVAVDWVVTLERLRRAGLVNAMGG